MTLALHTITPSRGSRPKKTRVGRGNASGRGTTAGRGTKGQRARTGGRKRLKMKGMRQMLLSFPKRRGFTSAYPTVYDIRIGRVVEAFKDGDRIDLAALKSKKLVPKSAAFAKVIGGGTVDRKLTFVGIRATASVKADVEKAGGSFGAAPKRSVKKTKDAKKA
ncbi:50S ribosomal protein L15 [Candidatus Uhrbacteria bacterium]|nr:50S ribosomal protein L15 [Candidatus Uhrbacteria bacterium]